MIAGTVLQRFADCFVPSDRNGQLPYLLTPAAASAYLLIALVLLLTPTYLRVTELASLTQPFSFTKDQMVSLTNQARTGVGLPTLAVNPVLEQAAAAKAADMLEQQYFAHVSPTGKNAWNFIKGAGYQYLAAGENLAEDFSQASDAQVAFMNSPSHRDNILNPLYTEVGIVVAQGMLNGHESIVVVEYFGKPKPTPTPKPTPKPTTSSTTVAGASTTRPGASTTVVSNITVGPNSTTTASASTPVVLGTAESQSKLESAKEKIMTLRSYVPESVKVKIIALFLMFSILTAMAFMINRAGYLPLAVGVRSLILLLLLGYAATFGVRDWHAATITPVSASIMEASAPNL